MALVLAVAAPLPFPSAALFLLCVCLPSGLAVEPYKANSIRFKC